MTAPLQSSPNSLRFDESVPYPHGRHSIISYLVQLSRSDLQLKQYGEFEAMDGHRMDRVSSLVLHASQQTLLNFNFVDHVKRSLSKIACPIRMNGINA